MVEKNIEGEDNQNKAMGSPEKWDDVLKDANWKIENGIKSPEEVAEAPSSDQKMKVDSEAAAAKEETKDEPVGVLGQILSHQKVRGEKKLDKFGGGVNTNDEVTVK